MSHTVWDTGGGLERAFVGITFRKEGCPAVPKFVGRAPADTLVSVSLKLKMCGPAPHRTAVLKVIPTTVNHTDTAVHGWS